MAVSEQTLDYAAFDLWLMGEGEDNRVELEKLKRVLPIVLEECCTEKQRTYIMHYFVDQMSIPEIAAMYQRDKATISKTIHRGLATAYKYLRFVSPLFVKQPQRRGYLRRKW